MMVALLVLFFVQVVQVFGDVVLFGGGKEFIVSSNLRALSDVFAENAGRQSNILTMIQKDMKKEFNPPKDTKHFRFLWASPDEKLHWNVISNEVTAATLGFAYVTYLAKTAEQYPFHQFEKDHGKMKLVTLAPLVADPALRQTYWLKQDAANRVTYLYDNMVMAKISIEGGVPVEAIENLFVPKTKPSENDHLTASATYQVMPFSVIPPGSEDKLPFKAQLNYCLRLMKAHRETLAGKNKISMNIQHKKRLLNFNTSLKEKQIPNKYNFNVSLSWDNSRSAIVQITSDIAKKEAKDDKDLVEILGIKRKGADSETSKPFAIDFTGSLKTMRYDLDRLRLDLSVFGPVSFVYPMPSTDLQPTPIKLTSSFLSHTLETI
eukprot:Platyproteum_vivax@DN6386_c0_g1_i2.p1